MSGHPYTRADEEALKAELDPPQDDPPRPGKAADLAGYLRAAGLAMELEGIPEGVRERVINRLVYGDPAGARPRVTVHVPPVSARLDAIADSLAAVLAKRQATARPFRW